MRPAHEPAWLEHCDPLAAGAARAVGRRGQAAPAAPAAPVLALVALATPPAVPLTVVSRTLVAVPVMSDDDGALPRRHPLHDRHRMYKVVLEHDEVERQLAAAVPVPVTHGRAARRLDKIDLYVHGTRPFRSCLRGEGSGTRSSVRSARGTRARARRLNQRTDQRVGSSTSSADAI